MNTMQAILLECDGVEVIAPEWGQTRQKFMRVGDIVPRGDIFVEIIGTATKGTIGRVVSVEVRDYQGAIYSHQGTLTYEVEGRPKPGKIGSHHANVLKGPQQTKYVRVVKSHPKVKVKNPINKFKQELQVGDLIAGVSYGKSIKIGKVSRWTNSTIWAVTGDDISDKSKEFKLDNIQETFKLPNAEAVNQELTMSVLRGGRNG